MPTYNMRGMENLSPGLVTIVNQEIGAGAGETYSFRTSQKYIGASLDRIRRQIVYSGCTLGTDVSGTSVNTTGYNLYSGLHTILDGASFDITNFKNWSIFTKSIDSGAVAQYEAWTVDSLVPNGIGPSDGTYRRFVEADYYTQQIPKLVDPRTGNVWSHHIASSGLAPDLSCLIYEFRRDESYTQTISPYVPPLDYHIELIGIGNEWVYVWTYGEDLLHLLPRVRTVDEIAADCLLSYADFATPTDFNGALAATRVTLDADGNIYWLWLNSSSAVARDIKLYKFTKPTSAPFGGPVVGGGFTDVTPWTSSTGPNTSNGNYRGWVGSQGNTDVMWRLPADNNLVCITKRLPRQKYPVSSTDPNDLFFDCTYVDLTDLSFDYHEAFVTGYVTADWVNTPDPNAAAWAILDCAEHDADLARHDYDFSAVADYSKRWFSFMVIPVFGGVIQGTYNGLAPYTNATFRVLVEYQFVPGATPVATTVLTEQLWDDGYTNYATAIGHTAVVNYSMAAGEAEWDSYYDCGIWDSATTSWWYSGANTNMWSLEASLLPRQSYMANPPFLKLSYTTPRTAQGQVCLRYGDQ